ncbi:MAG: gamma-glutamyltransferase [Alphaproteobacteria bacterium]|nr:gamma-glutamyltransferase [Alphaproteobacteria bacterium]MCB9791859.1 gamma-glutamyltransferase [Alphaproteobacteria bacterium]
MRRPLASLLLLSGLAVALAAAPPPEQGHAGLVAADHALASEAGAEVLSKGGNAVDAAVATALSAGVVQPAGSGLGGGGFAVVMRDGVAEVLDFREIAPSGASRDMYLGPDGEVVPGLSTDGGLAVAVPGEARGLVALHERYGKLDLMSVAAPAIRQAQKGFAVGAHLAEALEKRPSIAGLIFDGVARAPERGVEVRRRGLAKALRAFAQTAGEAFYTGSVAEDLVDAVQREQGVLTMADLAAYAPSDREVLKGSYRGYTIYTMPPPSSGGAVLLQVLGVLEGFDLASMGHNSSEHVHLLAEAMQHAFADRARLMGDPDFVEVPLDEMLSAARVEDVRRSIYPARTFPREHYGIPVAPTEDAGTQHISVIDRDGMAVALTTTINTSFGSKVVGRDSQIVLNNEMDDFVAKPGVPNAYGLVGLESNAVEPGKRPLSSMTPTIVLDPQGNVVMAVGASGGPFIISSTLQVISNVLDFGMDPEEAVSAPRMHHQWVPELLFLDAGYPADVRRALEARGHEVKEMDMFSSVQLVTVSEGLYAGASDPRKGGHPAAAR